MKACTKEEDVQKNHEENPDELNDPDLLYEVPDET